MTFALNPLPPARVAGLFVAGGLLLGACSMPTDPGQLEPEARFETVDTARIDSLRAFRLQEGDKHDAGGDEPNARVRRRVFRSY